VSSTNHLAPRYAVSTIPPLPRPSWVQIFSSAPCSQTPLASFPPAMLATKFHTHTKTRTQLLRNVKKKKSSLRFDIHTNTHRPVTDTLIFTIHVQVLYVFNGDATVYEPPLQVLLIIHHGRCIVRMTCIIASYAGSHGFEFLSRRLHILHDIPWPSSVPSRISRDRVMHCVTDPHPSTSFPLHYSLRSGHPILYNLTRNRR